MKCQNYGPRLGKLVHQLPEDVNLAYDLCLMCSIPRSKYLSEEYKFCHEKHCRNLHVSPNFPQKRRLGPQNGSGSSGPEKLLKIVHCAIIKETEKLKETMVGTPVE